MPEMQLRTQTQAATQQCGRALAPLLAPADVLLLSGDLGAGKTQLTKGIAAGLGVRGPVTSPTFNILLVHEGRIPLYHFDLYRLERAEELDDLDYFGTLEADGVSVVEWGDRFQEAAPEDGVSIDIRIEGDADRLMVVRALGSRGEALSREWAAACVDVEGVEVVVAA